MLRCISKYITCILSVVSPLVNISVETVGIQGNSLTLDCNPTGQPAPSVIWLRGPTQIQGNSRVMVDGVGRLIFSTVFSADADTYSCTATNDVGTASGSTQLGVLGETIEGTPLEGRGEGYFMIFIANVC